MSRRTPLHFLVASGLITVACQEPLGVRLGAAWVPDSSATLLRSDFSGIEAPVRMVLGDSSSWSRLWSQLQIDLPPRTLPAVDFRKETVLLAAIGSERTSGYGVRIDSVVL